MYGTDTNIYARLEVDLLILFIGYANNTIYVDGTGKSDARDVLKCGNDSLPCATLNYGSKHVTPSDTSVLKFIEGTKLNTTLVMGGYTLTPSSASQTELSVTSTDEEDVPTEMDITLEEEEDIPEEESGISDSRGNLNVTI